MSALAVIKDIRDVIAQLERKRTLLQLFGKRNRCDIADLRAAILFGHVETPEPLGLRLFFQLRHDPKVPLNFRILTRLHPALPTAALENVRRVREFRLQRHKLVADELLDYLAQAFFFGGQTKVHGRAIPYCSGTNGYALTIIAHKTRSMYHTSRAERKSASDIDPALISVLSGSQHRRLRQAGCVDLRIRPTAESNRLAQESLLHCAALGMGRAPPATGQEGVYGEDHTRSII